jgi:hypothetical protein
VNVTGWSRGLEVTAGGQGIVSHAGLALLRVLADRTGLTGGLSKALASERPLVHDRGRVLADLADLAAGIADGAEVISDFRVLADQRELFGPVASVPTAWRTLEEIAAGGPGALARIDAAVRAARRRAWAAIEARHGGLPPARVADKALDGVTCIRLDATVVPAHSDKEGAEPNFKGFGHHPLLAYCDNTGEALAGTLRPGRAGSNTVADHLQGHCCIKRSQVILAVNLAVAVTTERPLPACRSLVRTRQHPSWRPWTADLPVKITCDRF